MKIFIIMMSMLLCNKSFSQDILYDIQMAKNSYDCKNDPYFAIFANKLDINFDDFDVVILNDIVDITDLLKNEGYNIKITSKVINFTNFDQYSVKTKYFEINPRSTKKIDCKYLSCYSNSSNIDKKNMIEYYFIQ